MLKKNLKLFLLGIIVILSSCQPTQMNAEHSNAHKVTVKEILQTTSYTYLLVQGSSGDQWLALPSMQAKTGDVFYYSGGLEMKDFQSKELNRMFDKVIFLDRLSTDPSGTAVQTVQPQPAAPDPHEGHDHSAMGGGEEYTRPEPQVEKIEVKVEAPSGGITIAELFANAKSYAGKIVKIKGEVTKFTPAVMNTNWVHMQDGTDHKGKFDLTITTNNEVKVGDKVTFEGKISLDKDLGYGYFFDVIMEEAVAK